VTSTRGLFCFTAAWVSGRSGLSQDRANPRPIGYVLPWTWHRYAFDFSASTRPPPHPEAATTTSAASSGATGWSFSC